jgi:hypothetical protein
MSRPRRSSGSRIVLAAAASLFAAQCAPMGPAYDWQPVYTEMSGGLYSVWGYNEHDVYVVGADSRDGLGPTAIHFDGTGWTRIDTGQSEGDLWWVQGIGSDAVFMTGSGGTIVRYNPQTHTAERMTTPSTAPTIYGIWGASANDVWAVGGDTTGTTSAAGVIWHYDGTAWADVTVPDDIGMRSTLFKVWGRSASDVWVVGANSATVHWNGTAWSSITVPADMQGKLLTVHGNATSRYAVGGTGSGLLFEGMDDGSWRSVHVDNLPPLNGVYVPEAGNPIAVGERGSVVKRFEDGTWHVLSRSAPTGYDFHAVWVDPTGAVWAVGGQIAQPPATHGMVWHFGLPVANGAMTIDPALLQCPTTPGSICTYAGTGAPGFNGDAHHRRASTLYWPIDMEFSPSGQAFLLDWNNHRVRRVNADDSLETIIGTEVPGDGDPMMHDLVPPGVPGTTVALNHPTDILFDTDGTLLLMAWHNHKIRAWDPMTGNVVVRSGRAMGFAGDGGPFAMALWKQPSKFVFDSNHNLYIFDQVNFRIRRVDATTNTVSTIAGTGMRGFAGDGGDPLMAQFSVQAGENPEPEGGLAIDAMNHLFIADTSNQRIRMIDFAANTITTVVGTGEAGFSGEGGPASAAQINSVRDIEIGPDGDLYLADTGNHCVRRVSHTDGTIHTVAGVCGQYGYSGDRGAALQARLYRPFGIAFDHDGNLFIADTYNNRFRRVQH